MLQVRDVHFDYPDNPLLQQVNFTVTAGSLLHVVGGNGSGKTTLLKVLVGLIQPSQGEILFHQQAIRQNTLHYQQQLIYVGHRLGLNSVLTVRENMQFDVHYAANASALDALLAQWDLLEFADSPCGLLSAGQKRRVSLLRLQWVDVPLWFLDEPFTSLDKGAVQRLQEVIVQHLARGGMVIVTSHQPIQIDGISYQEYGL